MKTKIFIVIITIFFISLTAYADDVPKIVIDGFSAYKTSGSNEALSIWLKGSPLEKEKVATINIKSGLEKLEEMYGKMQSYEILRTIKISSFTNRIYAEIRYEKGPSFVLFDCYKSSDAWLIPTFRFHTDPERILPSDFFNMK